MFFGGFHPLIIFVNKYPHGGRMICNKYVVNMLPFEASIQTCLYGSQYVAYNYQICMNTMILTLSL